MADQRTLTIRMPADEYETLRGYAFVTDRSMNDVVREAIGQFLIGDGRRQQFESLLSDARSTYRAALDKLADS